MLVNSLARLVESKKEIDFDFSKSLNHNLNKNIISQLPKDVEESPIEPKQKKWKTINGRNKEYIYKDYEFNSSKSLLYFLEEVIFYSDQINHHPNINIEENKIVSIECFTKDMNTITELDLKLSRQIDVIYEDIGFIRELS